MKRVIIAACLLWSASALGQGISPAGGGGTPASPANSVQFNSAGAFGGSSGFTWNGTTITFPDSSTWTTSGLANLLGLSIAAPANTAALTTSGYSLTGSNAQSMVSLAGTINTSGVPDVVKIAVTDTAHGANTRLFHVFGGAAGTTDLFAISTNGDIIGPAGGGLTLKAQGSNSVSVSPGSGQNFSIAGGAGLVLSENQGISRPTTNDICIQTPSNVCQIRLFNSPKRIAMSGVFNSVGVAFASLPTGTVGDVSYITDGLAGSCGDGTCTTFGTTITGGGGALKLLAWFNGTNWTLVGK